VELSSASLEKSFAKMNSLEQAKPIINETQQQELLDKYPHPIVAASSRVTRSPVSM
jgi:hypothetical protein